MPSLAVLRHLMRTVTTSPVYRRRERVAGQSRRNSRFRLAAFFRWLASPSLPKLVASGKTPKVRDVVIIHASGPESNALADYAARRGWSDVHATSNSGELMRIVRSGRVAVVLCSGLRGLGGSLSELGSVVRELSDRGAGLVIPSLGVVDAPGRQTLLSTMDCVLESKAAIASERTTHGLARAKRRGVRLGRPRILDAYREDVARLRARGLSGRAIGRELGISNASVFQIIRHP